MTAFPIEDAERYFADEQAILVTGEPLLNRVETVLDPTGETRWLCTTKVPLRDAEGGIIGLVGMSHDITEARAAEQQIARLALIVESSNDAILSANLDGTFVSWNKAASRIFGYTEDEMIGTKICILAPPDNQEECMAMIAAISRGQTLENVETVRQTKDGRLIDVAMTVSPLRDADGHIIGASAIARDISEQKRLEREILEISDLEKRRIGQDLHDDLCQYLVGISLLSNVLHDNLKQQKRREAGDAQQINELVRQAVVKARNIAKGLAPLELTGVGLMNAFNDLASMAQRLFGVDCTFTCDSPVEISDATVATHFYRIAQEATHNAAKHSQGKNIAIRLVKDRAGACLTVRDDGIGYYREGNAAPSEGLGLHTMKYRARVIGAALDFIPNESRGTTVRCWLPLLPATA